MQQDPAGPVFGWDRCVRCGQCIKVCPTGTIGHGEKGHRLLIGGKLGRHPRLAKELPDIYDSETVRRLIEWCIRYYKENSKDGERFAALVEKNEAEFFYLLSAKGTHRNSQIKM